MQRLAAATALLLIVLSHGGCANYGLSEASFEFLRPALTDQQRAKLARLDYPRDAEQGPPIEAVVIHLGSVIRVTNQTAETIDAPRLWLNQRYVADLAEPIAPGQTAKLQLTSFVNQYERPFPIDTFFKPDSGFPVVLLETHDPRGDLRRAMMAQPTRERDIVEIVQAYNPLD
ncbi:MAG: hypothetical protein AAFY08_07140 [Planctomycetota bacterium]